MEKKCKKIQVKLRSVYEEDYLKQNADCLAIK